MNDCVKLISGLGIICLIIALGILYLVQEQPPSNAAKISFKAFEKFYLINPDRWELYSRCVECKIPMECYPKLFTTSEEFYFNFFDYQKYKKFLKRIRKNKIKTKNAEATAKMINAVKKDIADMESLAQQQQKQAIDNIASILTTIQN